MSNSPTPKFSFPRNYDVEGTVANAFPLAAFDSIEFPYSDLQVKGGIRFAKHEFPHSPGAEIEKMGRNPYEITFSAWFHDVPKSTIEKQYPGLYSRLEQLRERFEKEITADLVVPTVGTIKAVATTWTQRFNPQSPSGETFEITFIEDQDAATLAPPVIDLADAQALEDAYDSLAAAAALADFNKTATKGFFQALNDAVTSVLAIFGRADAMSRVVEGKIRALEQLISTMDSQIEEMQHPQNHLVVEALKDLWKATRDLQENIVGTTQTIRTWTTEKVMSVNQVAVALYGTSEKGFELLQLNSFKDSMRIPAGTDVKYIADVVAIFGQKTNISANVLPKI